jgi:hypothetical protein
MKILFNDIIQYSNAPDTLKSPALVQNTSPMPTMIQLDKVRPINVIGVGNLSGGTLRITFNDSTGTIYIIPFVDNGLYIMTKTISASRLTFTTPIPSIGRLAAGIGIEICTSIPKEPGWNSTSEPRVTLSGQIIPGRGGYNYRVLSLDSRYKITEEAIAEIVAGYTYIGMGYPFFIDLTQESYKLPYSRLYANERNQRTMSFEGGIAKYRYSRKWDFEERF